MVETEYEIEARRVCNECGRKTPGTLHLSAAGLTETVLSATSFPACQCLRLPRAPLTPAWLSIAREEIGTREVRGPKHNARILEYLSALHDLGSWGKNRDETPWCAAFVAWVLVQAERRTGADGNLPTELDGLAATWADYGTRVARWPGGLPKHDISVTQGWRLGDILVWPHHVAFYEGRTAPGGGRIHCLGGNQSDEVSIAQRSSAGLIAVQRPPRALAGDAP